MVEFLSPLFAGVTVVSLVSKANDISANGLVLVQRIVDSAFYSKNSWLSMHTHPKLPVDSHTYTARVVIFELA